MVSKNIELDSSAQMSAIFGPCDINIKTIENFVVKFQFMRAKATLKQINEISVSASIFGDYNHSNLLEIASKMSNNPILMIPSPWQLLMLEAAEMNLLNSSLGLYFVPETNISLINSLKYIIIPISKFEAICISHTLKEPCVNFQMM